MIQHSFHSITLQNAQRVTEWNQHACLWSKNYFVPFELCKNQTFFSVLCVFSGEEIPWVMHQSAIVFQSQNLVGVWPCHCLPLYVAGGRGRSLATTRFLDPNTSWQITCLCNYWRRPIGWLAQQSALCQAAIADHYWKNQSHKRSLGTVVILFEKPSVVCTSINDDSLKYFLRVGWFRVVLLVPVHSLLRTVASLKSWMQNWICCSRVTEIQRTEWHYTLTFYIVESELCGLSRGGNFSSIFSQHSSIIDYLSHLLS